MKLQSVNNQTTFTATAQFRPIAPKRLRGMLGIFGDFSTERTHFFKDDANRILRSIQDKLKAGKIQTSSKEVDKLIFEGYQDKKVFDFDGDTLILCNKPKSKESAPSAIYIAHEIEGKQGSTEIFRSYFPHNDEEYDKLTTMLEELPINK